MGNFQSSTGKDTISLLLATVLLTGVVGGGLFYLVHHKNPTPQANSQPGPTEAKAVVPEAQPAAKPAARHVHHPVVATRHADPLPPGEPIVKVVSRPPATAPELPRGTKISYGVPNPAWGTWGWGNNYATVYAPR